MFAVEINSDKIFETLKGRSGHYDPKIMGVLKKVIENENQKILKEVDVEELEAGMIIAQDILTKHGTRVASKWQELTITVLERIKNIANYPGIPGPIKIIKQKR